MSARPGVMTAWAAVWGHVARAVIARVVPAVSLKVARARALLMAVVAGVTVKVIATMARVMVQVAAMATVEAVRNMAEAAVMVMIRMNAAMARVTAEARVVRVMAEERDRVAVRDRVMVAVNQARVRVMDQAVVMDMARADRVMDAVARTTVRVARATAVAEARVKVAARDNPISTVTATAVVAIWDTASNWTNSAAPSCLNNFKKSKTATAMVAVLFMKSCRCKFPLLQ